MGAAQQGTDAQDYFAAVLGKTRYLAVTSAPVQFSDADGPLVPGRYLLHIADTLPLNAPPMVWVNMGPFVKGETLAVAAETPYGPPFQDGRVLALEVNVRPGLNDQVSAITASGSAILYLTRISRGA